MPDPTLILVPIAETQTDIVDGEAILIHPASQRVRMLNAAGTLVWTASDGRRSLAEIATLLSQTYQIDLTDAERDVLVFADSLIAAGLATLVAPPA